MFKDLIVLSIGVGIGFVIGNSSNDDFKNEIEKFISKAKILSENLLVIVLRALDELEGIETEEILINLENFLEIIKKNFSSSIDIQKVIKSIENKIEVRK